MKDYIQLLAAFLLILILIPCIGYADKRTQKTTAASAPAENTVRLLDEKTGEITSLSMHDYITGSVFAQMPADFDQEALNAQAVLASTYAKRRILTESTSPDKSLKGAHLSTDTDKYQAYFTEDQAKELYGADYDKAYKKISKAADYAEGLTLCYDNEPIIVAFHGISFGKTESALSVWGRDIPYLQSADSSQDTEKDEFRQVVTLSRDEMKALLQGEFSDISLSENPEEWIQPVEVTEAGTILKLNIGGRITESTRFCELMKLKSAHFEISFSDEAFVITVSGCGHLVGMSQYGADAMAKSGSSCEEILLHYFRGTTLVKQ